MNFNFSEKEGKIIKFWKNNKIFEKSIKQRKDTNNFVFYEGPPTANGRPGIHHILARAFKDLIPRYKTMRGYRVERKAGWDTHGLPVELEVEKTLGLKNKKDIENYGIEKFNQKCRESVWKYKEEWEKMTARIGFWVDLDNPYITYDNNYIESLWWIIKQIDERKLLYRGYKVIPQCPRCGTALSSHEVAQGYKNIEEDSVYIKFKVKGKNDEYILAWTTTPWTLPGNVALAVGKNINYMKVRQGNDFYYLAKNLLNKLDGKYEIVEEMAGQKLIDLEYEPLFAGAIKESDKNFQNAFKVYTAEFVSTDDGTGIIHTAVMYGVEDYELGEKVGLPKIHTVNLDGTFNKLVPQWEGKFVKNAEKEIIDDLKKRNILYKTEKYKHDYPFCWRCGTPLIYYAKDSWYFKMSQLRDELIRNNSEINWVPKHIKEGRFGEWLREVKDWAISRERYWGTPIPIWICKKCGKMKVVGSKDELGVDKNFDLHRPYIDGVKLICECGGEMERTPEVMDCWFDSGSMPFAQMHYPFENKDLINCKKKSKCQYPADFIAEAIDQTRGWFYTLLAVSTLLDKGVSYKNVICLGHILDKNGQKMSKSKGNVVNPWEVIERYGVDSVRWYFYTMNQPGEPKRFNEEELKESNRFFITLLNVLNFYKIFSENKKIEDLKKDDLVNILDKWITSKLNLLIKDITKKLDEYDITTAGREIEEFINDLSIWYVRRSRVRFKDNDQNAIKILRHILLISAKAMAPFTPFISEYIYQEIGGEKESVHLCDWPEADEKLIDKELEEKMKLARDIVALALAERAAIKIKVRQPLASLKIKNQKSKIKNSEELLDLIKDEVNVKEIIFDDTIKKEAELDKEISLQLKEEGIIREVVHQVQDIRKKAGLKPKDKISVYYSGADYLNKVLSENEKIILDIGKIKDINLGRKNQIFDIEKELVADGQKLWIGIKKVR